jgi:pyrrolidone-carboxylate peptidase
LERVVGEDMGREAGLPEYVSKTAGSYVCNQTF